tara:strand:- start:222 stop:350 length:129 start_codon:yes stop_codon:yes gene_type:complete
MKESHFYIGFAVNAYFTSQNVMIGFSFVTVQNELLYGKRSPK